MRRTLTLSLLFASCLSGSVMDTGDPTPTPDGGSSAPSGSPPLLASEILGRPTARSIAVSIVPQEPFDAYIELGTASGSYSLQTPVGSGAAGTPFVITADGLLANTSYFYRLRWRRPGDSVFSASTEHSFHTQRPPGSTFRFTLQSDSHLDENSVLAMYQRTLGNILSDAGDFHIDLGDTFMCEKHTQPFDPVVRAASDQATVNTRYLYERGNFGVFAHSIPLFLVNGNHEGEIGYLSSGSGQDIATFATRARQSYYLNPTPDDFYGGDGMNEPLLGQRAAWYSWQWGDALFVVLDPYWQTKIKTNTDGWAWTLGDRQYQWLQQTLANSSAKFKFVFLHNLVGGLDGQMRGGVEAAPFFEWGGQNADGTLGFASKRPGWSKPIHQLLVDNKVSVVFHGHDHLYAKQDLDGLVYQEVPQPSAKNTNNAAMLAATYHYAAGTILASAGHLRVTVAPDKVTSEYVRAWLPANETATRKNAQVDDSWAVLPK